MKGNPLFPNTQGLLPTEIVTKSINVKTIIQCGGLWFANGKFGVTWRLFQAQVQPKVSLKGKCLFAPPSEAEKAMLKASADTDDDVEIENTKVPVVYAEDSDDEEVVQTQPVVITKQVEPVATPEKVEPEVNVKPEVETEPEPEPAVVADADTSVKKKVVRKKPAA
jgi:hypothetical protein